MRIKPGEIIVRCSCPWGSRNTWIGGRWKSFKTFFIKLKPDGKRKRFVSLDSNQTYGTQMTYDKINAYHVKLDVCKKCKWGLKAVLGRCKDVYRYEDVAQ